MCKLILKTENTHGVLLRVVSVISRDGHNIHSLYCAPTPDSQISEMEISIESTPEETTDIQRRLLRLYDVLSVAVAS
ncbi:MAG: hypothetical protein FWH05_00630 [Oscillospiraceae bacterium]|nr:hypothetical protein [Oscillospiraceae bacterium]